MSTSTRPRKTAASKSSSEPTEVSDVASWKKPAQIQTLPSGNRMKIKRTNLQALMAQGMVPNALMTLVQKSVAQGSTSTMEEELREILNDPTKLAELMSLMDSVTVACALEPRVHFAPESEDDRRDDLLYVDEIDEADKTAIFNFATGGVSDLEPFRQQA